MVTASRLELGVLGPLEVRAGPRAVVVGGMRQRLVLAALSLNAGRCVDLADLVAVVWDEEPPATARQQISNAGWRVGCKIVVELAARRAARMPRSKSFEAGQRVVARKPAARST
jgi:hypothetical protein